MCFIQIHSIILYLELAIIKTHVYIWPCVFVFHNQKQQGLLLCWIGSFAEKDRELADALLKIKSLRNSEHLKEKGVEEVLLLYWSGLLSHRYHSVWHFEKIVDEQERQNYNDHQFLVNSLNFRILPVCVVWVWRCMCLETQSMLSQRNIRISPRKDAAVSIIY